MPSVKSIQEGGREGSWNNKHILLLTGKVLCFKKKKQIRGALTCQHGYTLEFLCNAKK